MRRIIGLALLLAPCLAAATAPELGITYSVRVDNLTAGDVLFKLDGGKSCTARSQASCSWDIDYGSHSLEAYVGGLRYVRDFELSDESDIQVHCKFDGSKFSGDSC
ncbi:MAG TPA: hypothetical protein VHP13_03760 [Gammaproteobacteria bacterium]|jgi:hypothetical protein|nr:hypothetical protein [Gammaproteobacteria bacterium]